MSDQYHVILQVGIYRDRVNLNPHDPVESFQLLKEYAKQFVERQYPGQKCSVDQILLFKHDYATPNLLQILQNAEDINNGSMIEIVMSGKQLEKPTHPHALTVCTFMAPTFCDLCGSMLIGLVKQGVRCTNCNSNFHKRCASVVHNRCTGELGDASDLSLHSAGSGLPHTFVVHTYKKPTVCKVCNNLLLGLVKQGLQCRDCKVNTHKKCAASLMFDCRPLPVDQPGTSGYGVNADAMDVDQQMNENASSAQQLSSAPCQMALEEKLSTGDMIQLARIPGQASVRTSRPKPTSTLMEGWLLHFTDKNLTRRRHYWVMDSTCITLHHTSDFQSASKFYKQFELASVLGVKPYDGAPYDASTPPHCFEILTKDLTYFVGENLEWYSQKSGHNNNKMSSVVGSPIQVPRRESGVGKLSAQKWLDAIRTGLLPPSRLAFDMNNCRSSQSAEGLEEIRHAQQVALEFSQLYQLYEQEELGCGQFGTVYGGVHRSTGRKIAVKVISKTRFGRKQKDQLRTEVAILQKISYPGIITLEAMFETKDRIFVVMEKMEADMLEMILSDRLGRLSERITKFLIVQILKALKYLHSQDIAHCDLKPENVLLSMAETDFPQTKLCDFGYARIIGENTFRKTVVGTPAYLAPEVLEKKGYNKSLDMWSVGVIIYVTLSGTFPFNEGEEIANQITNASFMYPSNPWSEMSSDSIDVINKLLRVNMDERLTVDECLSHPWLRDPQLYKDIKNLEERLGVRYLTCPEDGHTWNTSPDNSVPDVETAVRDSHNNNIDNNNV